MKKGLVIIGVILLVIGLLLFLFVWPIVHDAETPEDMVKKGEAGEYKSGDTAKVIGEVTEVNENDAASPTGKSVKLDGAPANSIFPVPDDLDVSKGDTVVLEYKFGAEGSPSEITAYKVPTPGGIIGLILLIVGIILLIVGAVTGKAAPMAPEQPPMDQPYMGEPPMEQPPMPPQ
ncbi:MAG: hypothetical protein JSW00_09540 [Thermoplasmata archaeon]|nr:MAG: hypothetical protein JSW00_09540 [Thermoplasmata archaeon]